MATQRHPLPLPAVLAAIALVASSTASNAACHADNRTPNIVFILADDLGYSGIGCFGATFAETPHLDRLAEQGTRMTSAYAPAPICSASRAAFLTGRSPARLHFEFVTKYADSKPITGQKLIQPPFTLNLPLAETTFAEALKPAGYISGIMGKWHVSQHNDGYLNWSDTHGPLQQGFDHGSEDRGSHPYAYWGDKEDRGFGDYAQGEFPEDAVTDSAIAFLEEHRDRPFLLYVPHYYVHDPVHTRMRWLMDKYQAKSEPWMNEKQVAYGPFAETLDHYVGQLLAALDRLGLADNTVVVFISDNGAHPEFTTNAPLRGSKWNLYEGGVRVPMIVRWPGRVTAGATCDTPVIGMDLLPTFCELAGADLPTDQPLDGVSLVPLLTGRTETLSRDTLLWHFPYYHPESGHAKLRKTVGIGDLQKSVTYPMSAVRVGRYKLVYFYEDDQAELYDLEADLGEQHDLAARLPEKTAKLKAALFDQLRRSNARLPVKNPDYHP